MLQRIQSIYLLVAGLILGALFIFPLVHNVYVNDKLLNIKVTGVYELVSGQNVPIQPFIALSVATAFVALLPLIIIFMYNNRKRQIGLCYIVMVIIIAYSYWVSQSVKDVVGDATLNMSNYGIGIILLSVSLLFVVLAQKAIQRDEKLVKSADRLR